MIPHIQQTVFSLSQEDLSSLDQSHIENYYVARLKPGKHSLVIPLGAKAKMRLDDNILQDLSSGDYVLTITDISGASWEYVIIK